MNTSHEFKDTISSKIEFLEKRALALQKARAFFIGKNYIEVDVPTIIKYPAIDAHIDSFKVKNASQEIGYLHTSPEYLMKRLLAMGMKRIFYIGHVFRVDEIGKRHNLEFTMVEWYQVGLSLNDLIDETLDFCKYFIGNKKSLRISYRDAFLNFLNIDPFFSDEKKLISCAKKNGLTFDSDLDKNGWLQLLFSHLIEPKFDEDIFYVVFGYPKSQAALSKTEYINGIEIAHRFEIYYNKIELANGYFELNDPDEQTYRFTQENNKRASAKKEAYPIDQKFIKSIKNLPECSGVSVGFDRLLMSAYKKDDIKDVISFSLEEL